MHLAWFQGGPLEILLILLLILLLFGARKLPDLARSLGRSLGEFKKGRTEGEEQAADAEAKRIDDDSQNSPAEKS